MRKACERCVHAKAVPNSGLHCARTGGRYRCEDERALNWFAAHAYQACGTRGRFFVDRLGEAEDSRWDRSVAPAANFGLPSS